MSIVLGLLVAAAPLSGVTITADDRQAVVVSAKDLDLTRDADVRRLERRVAIARQRVCDIGQSRAEALQWTATCQAEAAQRATVQIGQVVAAARLGRGAQLSAR